MMRCWLRHGLGGSWCPFRESEKIGGKLWVVCSGVVCGVSVFSRVIGARLGIREDFWKVRAVSLGVSSGLCWALFYAIGFDVFWRFGGGELGMIFGLGLPFVAAVMNMGMWMFAASKRCLRKFGGA